MKRASSASRRSLLHKNKLNEFKAWVVAQGYIIMKPTGHEYEVLRLQKYNPSGTEPDIFFHKRLKTDHITVTRDGEKLVKQWLAMREEREQAFQVERNKQVHDGAGDYMLGSSGGFRKLPVRYD